MSIQQYSNNMSSMQQYVNDMNRQMDFDCASGLHHSLSNMPKQERGPAIGIIGGCSGLKYGAAYGATIGGPIGAIAGGALGGIGGFVGGLCLELLND